MHHRRLVDFVTRSRLIGQMMDEDSPSPWGRGPG